MARDWTSEQNPNFQTGAFVGRQRSCDHCGQPYLARKPASRYCSDRCRIDGTRYGRSYGNYAPRQFGVWRQGQAS